MMACQKRGCPNPGTHAIKVGVPTFTDPEYQHLLLEGLNRKGH